MASPPLTQVFCTYSLDFSISFSLSTTVGRNKT